MRGPPPAPAKFFVIDEEGDIVFDTTLSKRRLSASCGLSNPADLHGSMFAWLDAGESGSKSHGRVRVANLDTKDVESFRAPGHVVDLALAGDAVVVVVRDAEYALKFYRLEDGAFAFTTLAHDGAWYLAGDGVALWYWWRDTNITVVDLETNTVVVDAQPLSNWGMDSQSQPIAVSRRWIAFREDNGVTIAPLRGGSGISFDKAGVGALAGDLLLTSDSQDGQRFALPIRLPFGNEEPHIPIPTGLTGAGTEGYFLTGAFSHGEAGIFPIPGLGTSASCLAVTMVAVLARLRPRR